MALLQADGDWSAAGHADSWLESGGAWTGGLGLALLVALVLVAIVRSHRYRASRALAESDRAALAERIGAAEHRTTGEIVCVVVERADRHPGAAWLAALATLLVGSALLAGWLPWGHPAWLLVCQTGLAALGLTCARLLPDFLRRFVSERRATEVAGEQAVQEFHAAGITATEARTGILIFVALLERRAVVLADAGIDARVDSERWSVVDGAVLDGVRRGDLAGGLGRAIDLCAEVLEEHFPGTADDRDELPNHLVVRSE